MPWPWLAWRSIFCTSLRIRNCFFAVTVKSIVSVNTWKPKWLTSHATSPHTPFVGFFSIPSMRRTWLSLADARRQSAFVAAFPPVGAIIKSSRYQSTRYPKLFRMYVTSGRKKCVKCSANGPSRTAGRDSGMSLRRS